MPLHDGHEHVYQRRPATRARSPFRYPGGKGFLTDLLRKKVCEIPSPNRSYAEPFCGGAGAAINLLLDGDVDYVLLNDLDPKIYSAWIAIVKETERFVQRLENVEVTVEEWKVQKEIVASHVQGYDFDAGFATFFLNRTSRAGIVVGSGPIGGYEQAGSWKIDARFYRSTMIKRIKDIGVRRAAIHVTNLSGVEFIRKLKNNKNLDKTFMFIDPPYFEIGSRLYLDGMGDSGHKELAEELRSGASKNWLMTYDNHDEVRKLYTGFKITELQVLYSLQRQRKVNEIVVQAAGA